MIFYESDDKDPHLTPKRKRCNETFPPKKRKGMYFVVCFLPIIKLILFQNAGFCLPNLIIVLFIKLYIL